MVIAATVARDSSGPPPERSIRPNASRSSAVETSPPPPDSNAGGRLQAPSTGSYTDSAPVAGSVAYEVTNRSSEPAGTLNPVSVIPSGPNTRSARNRDSGIPAARATSTPSTSIGTW